MSWAGLDRRTLFAALFGVVAAFIVVRLGSRHHIDLGWTVGLVLGFFVAAAATADATMRGLFVGTVAVWTLAATRTLPPGWILQPRSVLPALGAYHLMIDGEELVVIFVCASTAVVLGMRSFRTIWSRGAAGV